MFKLEALSHLNMLGFSLLAFNSIRLPICVFIVDYYSILKNCVYMFYYFLIEVIFDCFLYLLTVG